MSETIYVVVAGDSYSHAPPRKAFHTRREAKEYKEQMEEAKDWAKVEEIVLEEDTVTL